MHNTLNTETGTDYLQSFKTSHSRTVTQGTGKPFRIVQLIIRTQQKASSVQSQLVHIKVMTYSWKGDLWGYLTDLRTFALRKSEKRKPSLATTTSQYGYCHFARTAVQFRASAFQKDLFSPKEMEMREFSYNVMALGIWHSANGSRYVTKNSVMW